MVLLYSSLLFLNHNRMLVVSLMLCIVTLDQQLFLQDKVYFSHSEIFISANLFCYEILESHILYIA